MKTLVVYDSAYGNTKAIAVAIGAVVGGEARVVRSGEVGPLDLGAGDLLIAGSPTYGGKPTPAMLSFLDSVSESAVKGVNVAAFDTRLSSRLAGVFGYAAPKIASALETRGGKLVLAPEGFAVKGKKGPLVDGELEHAARWSSAFQALHSPKR
jgi:flavodoxin